MTTSDAVSDLVARVLSTIQRPYPRDITDQVCQAIEGNRAWLAIYNDLVAEGGRQTVNSTIGRMTLQHTGLENLGVRQVARSSLIKTYTELGRGPRSE